MTLAECAEVVRDLVVAAAAIATAWAAVHGVNSWLHELRGRTRFESARQLLLETYKMREALYSCRSPLIFGWEFPSDAELEAVLEGRGHGNLLERARYAHVFQRRLTPVFDALREFEARALEAEALWGAEIRTEADRLKHCFTKLHSSIEAFLDDKQNDGADFANDRDFAVSMRSNVFATRTTKDNTLNTEIAEAISGIEKVLKPHIGAS